MQPAVKQLEQYKQKIEPLLESFFNSKIEKAKLISPASVEMIQLLKEFNLRGGKRIRAAMIFYGYKCFKGNNEGEILKASMSIELAHSFLLIHDDIIDQDSLRRNGPTIHESYRKIFSSSHSAKHFGTSFALLAGDILYSFSNEILASLNIDDSLKLNAIKKLNHVIHQVIYGESLDILSSLNPDFTKAELEKTHYLKTASYTIEGPLHIGALLAGADESQLKVLSNYAVPLGKAFQLQDDILGLYGSEEELGKHIGSDIKEGKRTLLILKALELASKKDSSFILSCLGKKSISEKHIERIRAIVKSTSSLQYSQTIAKSLINESKKAISNSSLRKEGKDFLLGIADYMLERSS